MTDMTQEEVDVAYGEMVADRELRRALFVEAVRRVVSEHRRAMVQEVKADPYVKTYLDSLSTRSEGNELLAKTIADLFDPDRLPF